MGCVAQEEHVAVSPAVRQLGPEGVLRHAPEHQPVARDALDPRPDEGQERFDRLEVGGGLTRKQPELPAVTRLADPHVRRCALGVADLVHALPLVELDRAVHVDHEPALLEVQVLHRGADRGSHHAVGSVAAQDVRRQHGLVLAAEPVGEVHPHPAPTVLGDVGDVDVPAQRDRGLVLEVGAHQLLELGLVEHVGLGVAVPPVVAVPVEHREHPVVAVDQLQPAGGPRHCRELLGDAESSQDPVDLVVEVDGPGLGVDPVPAVQDQALHAVLPEQGCGGDADGAGSDDDDGNRVGTVRRGRTHRRSPTTSSR